MAVEIITKDDLQVFKTQLLEDIRHLINKNQEPLRPWLRSVEVRNLLQISPGTLMSLRVKGILKFKRVGSIMFYRYEDVMSMIEQDDNSIPASHTFQNELFQRNKAGK
ncbi:MAG: helix-turn-helix domain-containing protein [Saprospiraceae bacterium]